MSQGLVWCVAWVSLFPVHGAMRVWVRERDDVQCFVHESVRATVFRHAERRGIIWFAAAVARVISGATQHW